MIIQPFSFLQQATTLAAPPAVTPTIRFDANSASISLALPFNYFAGSFGMGSIISDVSANVRN